MKTLTKIQGILQIPGEDSEMCGCWEGIRIWEIMGMNIAFIFFFFNFLDYIRYSKHKKGITVVFSCILTIYSSFRIKDAFNSLLASTLIKN